MDDKLRIFCTCCKLSVSAADVTSLSPLRHLLHHLRSRNQPPEVVRAYSSALRYQKRRERVIGI